MSDVDVSSKPSSGPTSASKPVGPASTEPAGTARQFLDAEADRAKKAMSAAFQQAKAAFGGAVDPLQLPRKHPFLSVSSAVLAGFAAAVVTIPSKEQQELRRLAKIREAMMPPRVPDPKQPAAGQAVEVKSPWWSAILRDVMQILKPLLTAAITAGIAKKSKEPPAADTTKPAE